ncbi:Amino acid ABC transporter [Klebsiella michiganensis]|nr:Amino acid ABC transporter [Klebsiella michiganensis]
MNQWAVIWSVRDSFIAGLLATLELFITAAIAGLIIGVVLCYLSEYQKKTLNRLIIAFVSLMRAIPFLILAYLLYYGLPQVGISMEPWTAGLIALIIYHGAYFFEILRSQRRVFSGGYIEAAVAQGFFALQNIPPHYSAQYSLFRAPADGEPADYLPERYRFPQHYHRPGDNRCG